LIAVKGSPREVLARCVWEALPDGRRQILTTARRAEIEVQNADMAEQALRVLGTAYRQLRVGNADVGQTDIQGLIWTGLVGLADPVRPRRTAAFRRAGSISAPRANGRCDLPPSSDKCLPTDIPTRVGLDRSMSIPPVYRRLNGSAAQPLDYEIAQEKAAALGRLGRALEQALAALAAFDADHPEARRSGEGRNARAALVESAGHALWLFIVQRDACGLRDARTVMRDYRVPAEVQARAGAFPPRLSSRGS
jgi:hypothetical protein